MQRLMQHLAAIIAVGALTLTGCSAQVTPSADLSASPAARANSSGSSAAATPATPPAPSPAPVQSVPQSSQPSPTAPPVSAPPSQPASPSPKTEVKIVSLTSPIRHGSNATAVAQSSPSANCNIDVIYKSGSSTAQGLYPKKADSQGRVAWTWMVGTRTTPGSWPVIITCDGVTARAALVVQ